jgi:hypothetical protein
VTIYISILKLFRPKGTDTVLNCNHHSNRFLKTTFEFQVTASTVKEMRSSVKWPNGQYKNVGSWKATSHYANSWCLQYIFKHAAEHCSSGVKKNCSHWSSYWDTGFQDIMFPYFRYGGENACLCIGFTIHVLRLGQLGRNTEYVKFATTQDYTIVSA